VSTVSDIKRALQKLAELVDEVASEVAIIEEVARLASMRVSIGAPTGVIDATVGVRERRAKTAAVGDRGIECVNTPYVFNTIRLYTADNKLRAEYIYTSKHVNDILPTSVDVETVGDLVSLACNLSEEDVDRIIEAITKDRETKIKVLEQLKQIVTLVRMALGADESEQA
jgi:hypothetical protein